MLCLYIKKLLGIDIIRRKLHFREIALACFSTQKYFLIEYKEETIKLQQGCSRTCLKTGCMLVQEVIHQKGQAYPRQQNVAGKLIVQ